ncbi:hypothetical protein ABH945_006321 [Paraburkholderia sp. GAS333]
MKIAAPKAAAAHSTTRSRLDSVRSIRASDTLAQSAKLAASEPTEVAPGRLCMMSCNVPNAAAMP